MGCCCWYNWAAHPSKVCVWGNTDVIKAWCWNLHKKFDLAAVSTNSSHPNQEVINTVGNCILFRQRPFPPLCWVFPVGPHNSPWYDLCSAEPDTAVATVGTQRSEVDLFRYTPPSSLMAFSLFPACLRWGLQELIFNCDPCQDVNSRNFNWWWASEPRRLCEVLGSVRKIWGCAPFVFSSKLNRHSLLVSALKSVCSQSCRTCFNYVSLFSLHLFLLVPHLPISELFDWEVSLA